ncbi:MAG: hypothetical protein JWQ28_751 [Pedobacter sp.]|jgi:hypothetical protein|nr:hypothetical protein [Pedobacter sp.]
MYYFFSKRKPKAENARSNTIDSSAIETWNDLSEFQDETEEHFYKRFEYHFESLLNDYCYDFYFHALSQSFMVRFPDYPGRFYIQPVFSFTQSYVQFHGVITMSSIPDNQLNQVSELINRLNGCRVLSSLYLDYEDRHIKFKSIFNMPKYNVENETILFHLDAALQCFELRPYLNRVVFHNEEPVLVALDYAN